MALRVPPQPDRILALVTHTLSDRSWVVRNRSAFPLGFDPSVANRIRMIGRGAFFTISTGQGAWRATCIDTLPNMNRSSAPKPRFPSTIIPSSLRCFLQDRVSYRAVFFHDLPLELHRRQGLLGLSDGFIARFSRRSISSLIKSSLPTTTGCTTNGARTEARSTT